MSLALPVSRAVVNPFYTVPDVRYNLCKAISLSVSFQLTPVFYALLQLPIVSASTQNSTCLCCNKAIYKRFAKLLSHCQP